MLALAGATAVLAQAGSAVAGTMLAHGGTDAGYDGPPPLSAWTLLTRWEVSPVLLAILVVVVGLYLLGVHRLRGRGDAWAPWRLVFFLGLGVGTVVVATMSGLAAYEDTLFSAHMVQHMILSMVSPVFLALGAPITLALRTLPPPPRRQLLRLLHSRFARVVGHPLFGGFLFVISPFALYFTSIYPATLRNPMLHELLHVHFLLVGCLFFWPLLGLDPLPGRLPYPLRMLVVFATLPFHAFLGVSIMGQGTLIAADWYESLHRPWSPDLLADQHTAGGLLWASGDLFGLLFIGVLLVQWMRADERDAVRDDRRIDRLVREHREDTSLAAYNARLASLAERDRRRSASTS